MIINGGARSGGAFFSRHLMRADENERVSVVEMRGLAADNVRDAFHEMEAVASGTRVQNYFYHANMNTRADEHLTPEQWEQATDTLERELGLSGQPRFVVEHEKEGRTHRHVVWSRIDADSMTSISDAHNYRRHELAAREIEQAFGLAPVASVHAKDRETGRPERRPEDWESFRSQESGIDPQAIKAEITALWQAADSGQAFRAALEEQGYILAKGDRRDFCIIDQAGDEHSLARRISGAKAAEIRARMADIDRDSLPSVAEARELAQEAADATAGGTAAPPPPAREVEPESVASTPATPDITLAVAHDLAAPLDGLQPVPPGELGRLGEAVPPGTLPAETDGSGVAREATGDDSPIRVTAWGSAWRAFADKSSEYADRLQALLRDESSGTPAAGRGWASRIVDAGRQLIEGLRHHGPPEAEEDPHGARPGQSVEWPAPDDAPRPEPEARVEALPPPAPDPFEAFLARFAPDTELKPPSHDAPQPDAHEPDREPDIYHGPELD